MRPGFFISYHDRKTIPEIRRTVFLSQQSRGQEASHATKPIEPIAATPPTNQIDSTDRNEKPGVSTEEYKHPRNTKQAGYFNRIKINIFSYQYGHVY
jgi:hypothetical protein